MVSVVVPDLEQLTFEFAGHLTVVGLPSKAMQKPAQRRQPLLEAVWSDEGVNQHDLLADQPVLLGPKVNAGVGCARALRPAPWMIGAAYRECAHCHLGPITPLLSASSSNGSGAVDGLVGPWEAEGIAKARASTAAGYYATSAEVNAWIDSLGTDNPLPVPYPCQPRSR